MHRIGRQSHGFTLIEAVLSMGIAALVFAAIAALIDASFFDAAKGDAKAQADAAATYATNRIVREAREAKRVWCLPYQWEWGEYQTLWIVYPVQTGGGWYDREQDGESVAYFLWDDRLYRWSPTGGYHRMIDNIESIGFLGAGDVITVSITANVQGQRATRSEQICLRNT